MDLGAFTQAMLGGQAQQQPYWQLQDQYAYMRDAPVYYPPATNYYPTARYVASSDDTDPAPEEPEESPSEFKQLSNHDFHTLLDEFANLMSLCITTN